MKVAEAHIVAHAGCCLTPQSLRLLNHALVCAPGVAFDNAYNTDSLEVTPGGESLSVVVAAGSAFVEGANYAGEGMYFVSNDADVQLALDPADGADPRCDLIVAQVDGTATNCDDAWMLTSVTGVPAPDPACPAVPAGAVLLAQVTVPAGATSIVAGNINDMRESYELCTSSGLPYTQTYVPQQQNINRADGFFGLPVTVFTELTLPRPALVQVNLTAVFGEGGGGQSQSITIAPAYSGAYEETPQPNLRVLRGANFPLNGGSLVRFIETDAGTLSANVWGGGVGAVRGIDLEMAAIRWLG